MDSKFSHLPDISTIQPDRLIKYRVSEDRFSAEVLLPGFAYTDFDQKIGGKLSMWTASKLSESIRWQGMKYGFLYYPEIIRSKRRAMFVVGQTCYIEKRFHDIRYADAFGHHFPIRSYLNISDVGKSSFVVVVEWIDNQNGKSIAKFVTKVVTVSKETRKPIPLPEMFFAGLDTHFKTADRLTMGRMVELVIPQTAFKYETRALHSDTDMNGHVNQATFYSWSSDAASTAAIHGHLKHFSRHIELYPYKSIRVEYPGEAMVNDVVTVFVWEGDNTRCINVVMMVKEKKAFIMSIDFHEGGPIAVSPHLESQL